MRGHAAANIMPLAASNRVGKETAPDGRWDLFYGRSFISDWQGEKLAEMDRTEEGVRLAHVSTSMRLANCAAPGACSAIGARNFMEHS